MSRISQILRGCIGIILVAGTFELLAQEDIPWLADYSQEMIIGKESVRYQFTTVDGNSCKVRFLESVTGKKGEETRSWVFYLSDLDPASLQFNARGKSIQVTLETANGQEFISYFEAGEFKEYTSKLVLQMTEVDQTRDLIEALKEHIESCRGTETAWEDREAAFNWLTQHIGEALEGDVQWEQQLSTGNKPYLAVLKTQSVNGKGENESFEYLFDLSDINSQSIKLEASGRTLSVLLPVREGNRYIEVKTAEEVEFTDELTLFCDDIEVARQVVNAFSFVVSGTEPQRPDWTDYNAALDFIEQHLGGVTVGDKRFDYVLQFDLFASDILNISEEETDSDGSTGETTYSLYPSDLSDQPEIEATRREITLKMEVKDGNEFIIKSSGGNITGYTSRITLHAAGIDNARDLMKAWGYIIQHSEEEIESFESVGEVNSWLEDNMVPLYRGDETYEQKMNIHADANNQIIFERNLTEGNNEITESTYVIYPGDLSLDEMNIRVRLGKLTVTLETGKVDYIKYIKNGELQNFTDDTDVYFSDPLAAKNFMAAIRFLKEMSSGADATEMSREEAVTYLTAHIQTVELGEEQHEQNLERQEGDDCKLKFTRIEQGKDGESDEFNYEFMASDLSATGSELHVNGKIIEIQLETNGGEDLIKPYKNGEVGDFMDELKIYADDVLMAKNILGAFMTLAKACK